MKRLLFLCGTRPEAIKLAPLVLRAQRMTDDFQTTLAVTGQHREMLEDVLQAFSIVPDIDLHLMAPGQSLFGLTSRLFAELEGVFRKVQPDIVVVQGDTCTTFAGAMAAYYAQARIAHVEAGLRTGDKWAPFPEEMNRRFATLLADYHFAPTEQARLNLLREGCDEESVYLTGNTVIDALLWTSANVSALAEPFGELQFPLRPDQHLVLITGHRRENFGEPLHRICGALRKLAQNNPSIVFVYPVHLNPNVQGPVRSILNGIPNLHLLAPAPYREFIWLLQRSRFVITDSGGIQEEAPALGKPVLVTRRITERPEAIASGVARLVGDDPDAILDTAQRLIDDESFYASMAAGFSPYGDGKASDRILGILADEE